MGKVNLTNLDAGARQMIPCTLPHVICVGSALPADPIATTISWVRW